MSELMSRATPGLALAGVALASVWMFDPALHPEITNTAAASPAGSGTADGSTQSGSGSSTGSGTSTDSGASTDSGPTATADCSNAESVTGDAAMTPWGPVQVRMDFAADGTVCGVQAVAYPNGDRKSQMINSMAIPTLDAQAAQQGVSFDGFSGATYTTEAYRQSMQSILDQR
jgi:uncharacterized protein with FMN-binding domain